MNSWIYFVWGFSSAAGLVLVILLFKLYELAKQVIELIKEESADQ